MSNTARLSGAGGAGGGGSAPKVQPDSLFTDDMIEFTLGICEGPIGGLVSGPKSFYLDGTALQSADGSDNFTSFQLDVFHGDGVASVVHNELGGITSNSVVGVTLAQGVNVVRTTPSPLRNLIDILEIRLVVNQLLKTNGSGDQLEETADFTIEYRQLGGPTWLPFFTANPILLTGKTSGGYVKEMRKSVPRISTDWEIRVRKNNPDSSTESFVSLTWESIQCVTSEDRAYDNLAVVKGIARASDQFSSVPQFSGDYALKLILIPNNYDPLTRHYTGVWDGTLVLGHSDNNAWCAYDALMNPIYGLKRHLPEFVLDRFSTYEAGRWCDELVPRGTTGTFQPRFTYNDLIEEPRQGLEMAKYIMSTFGGILVSDLNKTYRMRVDRPGTPVQVIGPESVAEDTVFSYQYTDITQRANDLLVSFVNPELGWEVDARQVKDDILINKNGRIPLEFVAVGCIDTFEAQRRAFNMLVKANTEVCTVTYQTARQSLMLEIYDIVGIADPEQNWGLAGRVKSVAANVITLRDPLFLPVNTPLTLSLQTSTGVVTLTVRTAVANASSLTIDAPGVYPVGAPDRAQFVLSSPGVGLVKPFRIVGLGRDTTNPDRFNVVALEINTNRYSDVDNMVTSAPILYQGSLTAAPEPPVIALLQSGVAHQIMAADGVVTARIYVELQKTPGLATETEIFFARKDLDTFQSVKTLSNVAYIPQVETGAEYLVYAVAVSSSGRRSRASALSTHTVLARLTVPTAVTGWIGIPGFDSITLTGGASVDSDFAFFKVYASTSLSTALFHTDSFTATRYVRRVPPTDIYSRYKIAPVNRSGIEGPRTGYINVLPVGVTAADIDARGLNILNSAGTVIFNSNGEINGGAFVNSGGSNVLLSEIAANSLVPSLNYVGEFSAPPTAGSLGALWIQNAVYKNSTDGRSYVLTGTPLAWVVYLEDGRLFNLTVESTNGTAFKPGQGQSTLLIGRLFKNGAEVTLETPDAWFRWRRVSIIPRPSPNDDVTWNAAYYTGYKQVSVGVDSVYARATFFCDVIST